MTRRSIFQPRTTIPLILLMMLAACTPPAVATKQEIQQQNSQATQAAFIVQTEMVRSAYTRTPSPAPSATQTPVLPSQTPMPAASETPPADATPAPPAVKVTALPGLTLYIHPEIPDYVFQVDPALWEKDSSGQTANLVHKTIANCRIESVSGHGLGAPERYFWQDLGRFRWEVMDYGASAYVFPISGSGLQSSRSNFLNLVGYSRRTCRSAQEDVLSNLMSRGEAEGQISFVPFRSPTPRPALDNFDCPNTPPARLRVGDQVLVTTDAVWLRSAPRADDNTKVRKILHEAPFTIRVIGGPVCEKYVYWQVSVSEFGEASASTQGWLAEGDPSEQYLAPIK